MKKIKIILLSLLSIFIICLCIAKLCASNSTKTNSQLVTEIRKETTVDGNTVITAISDGIMIQNSSDSYIEENQVAVEHNTEEPTKEVVQKPTQEQTQVQTQQATQEQTQKQTQEATQEETQAPTESPTQAPTEVPTQAHTEPATQSKNNCPYTLYTITTRYVENGLAGSQEYIGYYYSNNEQTQDEIKVAMQLYKMGYINNMWVNVGDYDDHRKVAFAYYWK